MTFQAKAVIIKEQENPTWPRIPDDSEEIAVTRILPRVIFLFILTATTVVFLAAAVSLNGCSGSNGRPNILLIILDTVRDDYTGVSGGTRGLTPALDAVAAEGTVFHEAWANAPWTVPSHASMFTGVLSSTHDCNHQHTRLNDDWKTAAEYIADQGYETAAFYSNPWLSDRTTGLLRGFALKSEAPASGGNPAFRGDQGGETTRRQFSDWLEHRTTDKPFFAYVNFLEAHHPYDPPTKFRTDHLANLPAGDQVSSNWVMEYQAGLHPPETVDWARVSALYGGDVNTTDGLLAGVMAALEDLGVLDDTVVIITSDHGEHLGEHGLIAHQFSVNEPLLAVPLVIRAPGRLEPGDRYEPVMLSDLFTTLLDVAGVEPSPKRRHSISLMSDLEPGPRPLIAEYYKPNNSLTGALRRLNPSLDVAPLSRSYRTLRLGDLRLTVDSDQRTILHNIAVDPHQLVDISRDQRNETRALKSLLLESLEISPTSDEDISIDPATREQLRSLGYIH